MKSKLYRLEKLKLDEGSDSLLPAGYCSELPTFSLLDWETDTGKRDVTLKDIDVGWQVVLTGHSMRDYHRTSKIKEIVSRNSDEVVFHTQTSLYRITEKELSYD